MRIWAKEWQNSHLLRDMTIEDTSDETRTHKVFHAIDEICEKFDLQHPIWLDSTIRSPLRLPGDPGAGGGSLRRYTEQFSIMSAD